MRPSERLFPIPYLRGTNRVESVVSRRLNEATAKSVEVRSCKNTSISEVGVWESTLCTRFKKLSGTRSHDREVPAQE